MFFFQLPWLPELMLGRRNDRATSGIFRTSSRNPAMFPDEALEVYRANAARLGGLTAMLWYPALFRGRWLRNAPVGIHRSSKFPRSFSTLIIAHD